MFDKSIKKLIGYWIAWALTIWWASVIITNDDVAEQYKANTWKELTINEDDFVSVEESLEAKKQAKELFQAMYNELDCNKTDDYKRCTSVKSSFKDLINWLDSAIDCDTRISTKNNLEKSDITFCLNSAKELRDAVKNFYIVSDWTCNSECEEDLEPYEYNIAMFQAYLNKLN